VRSVAQLWVVLLESWKQTVVMSVEQGHLVVFLEQYKISLGSLVEVVVVGCTLAEDMAGTAVHLETHRWESWKERKEAWLSNESVDNQVWSESEVGDPES
jgi:hypothetical protein